MLRAIDFHGLKGVEFSKGEYTALLIPEMGANLVRLANTRLGAEILRTPGPGEIETFRSRPQVFGLPILFPPNRIADGRYVFEGRTYQYPITIERERNYHHGVLKSEAFLVSKARETDREVMIECRYYANAGNDAVYRDFPHEFKCKITYRLTAEGLEQEVVFFNRSETRMPLGVGFHTPLTIPFAGGTDADYVMRLAVGEEVELDGRNLPTGRRLPLSAQFSKLRSEGLQVTGCGPIEAGFTLREIDVDGKPFRGARAREPATRSTSRRPTGRCGTTEGKCPTAVPSRRHGPRTPPTPPIPRPKGFGPLTRASRGARLSACMRNSGKKRGSTGDPLFCLKTSRGRPSRRAVCAACRGGWDRPPGRRRSRSAGCSRVRRSPEGRTPRARLRV